MTYTLPMKDGDVDLHAIGQEIAFSNLTHKGMVDVLQALVSHAKVEERERIVGIVQSITPTLDDHKYPSPQDRHLMKVTEAGMRGLIVDAIMEDEK